MDYKKQLAFIIAVRLPIDMAEQIGEKVDDGKFKSMSEAVRTYTQAGMRFEKLQKIMEDPKKKAQLEENVRQAFEEQFHDETLETLDYDQLDAIYAKNRTIKRQKTGAVDIRCGLTGHAMQKSVPDVG